MTDTTITRRPSIGLALRSLLAADAQVLARSKQTFILNLAVPILMLLVTHNRTARVSGNGFTNPGFAISIALTFGLISSALMGYSITIARDREAGVFQRMRVTPAPTWAIMLSRLTVQFAAGILTTIIVLIVANVLYPGTITTSAYLLIFAVAILGTAVFLSIGQAIAGLIRNTSTVNAVSRLAYIVLILLGFLGVSGVLGDSFQSLANWTPVGALIALFTAVQDLTTWSWTDTGFILASAGYIVVFAGLGIRWFRWESS